MFIVFEGGEGSGKTTQVKLLARKLKQNGYKVLITHEPGGTDLGLKIRKLLLFSRKPVVPRAELFLFLADRAQHVEEVIRPALKQGKIVISDRFSGSTFAYQYYARQLENFDEIEFLDKYARHEIWPDLTILLDVPCEVGLARIKKDIAKKNSVRDLTGKKGMSSFELESLDFHKRLREGYLRLAKRYHWKVIDATLPVDRIASLVWKEVEKIL